MQLYRGRGRLWLYFTTTCAAMCTKSSNVELERPAFCSSTNDSESPRVAPIALNRGAVRSELPRSARSGEEKKEARTENWKTKRQKWMKRSDRGTKGGGGFRFGSEIANGRTERKEKRSVDLRLRCRRGGWKILSYRESGCVSRREIREYLLIGYRRSSRDDKRA